MDRKWMIVACFFSILTFISSIICSSLIFYNEKNRTEINSEKVLATNNIFKTSQIIYKQDSTINFSNVSDGYSVSRTFSVVNNNSNVIKYKVVWSNIVSSYDNQMLTYSLSCSNGEKVADKQIPSNDKEYTIIDNVEVKTNSTNNCTITINYSDKEELEEEQPEEPTNRSFGGKYQVIIIE
ncbi:MAG: hypothetical protein II625_00540 [Bacilli bacterium]|nr:hypothetical protein [Bacilli bacterium]